MPTPSRRRRLFASTSRLPILAALASIPVPPQGYDFSRDVYTYRTAR